MYAATGPTDAARLALEYAKALLRIAPVRVIPCDGAGIWPGYESLLLTQATGTYVNVVACGPDSWTRTHRYQLPPKTDPVLGMPPSSSWEIDPINRETRQIPTPPGEVVVERFDYWTEGVRNVLFAAAPPRDQWQLATARKFDVVVAPTNHAVYFWQKSHRIAAKMIGVPILTDSGHAALRAVLLPEAT